MLVKAKDDVSEGDRRQYYASVQRTVQRKDVHALRYVERSRGKRCTKMCVLQVAIIVMLLMFRSARCTRIWEA